MAKSRNLYMKRMPLDKRIEEFASTRGADECWIWPGKLNPKTGYAATMLPGTRIKEYVHRYAYEKLVGPIPEGLVVDHLCRNRACFNPAHLQVVTHRENILRGTGITARCAAKTFCPKGHPYDGDNLTLRPDGSRRCRTCDEEIERKRDRHSEPWYRRRQEARRAAKESRHQPISLVRL